MPLFKMYLVALVATGVLTAVGGNDWALFIVATYVVLLPGLAFINFAWKFYKYLLLPTPSQIVRGFKNLWPTVKKGPVVTRVHRPRP